MLKNNLKNPSDGFNMKLSFLTLFDSFLFYFRHFVFYNLIVVLVFLLIKKKKKKLYWFSSLEMTVYGTL